MFNMQAIEQKLSSAGSLVKPLLILAELNLICNLIDRVGIDSEIRSWLKYRTLELGKSLIDIKD